jgi:hypothetical protein
MQNLNDTLQREETLVDVQGLINPLPMEIVLLRPTNSSLDDQKQSNNTKQQKNKRGVKNRTQTLCQNMSKYVKIPQTVWPSELLPGQTALFFTSNNLNNLLKRAQNNIKIKTCLSLFVMVHDLPTAQLPLHKR